jgi:hypothetical protein
MRPGFIGFILFLMGVFFVPISGFAAPLPIDNIPQFRDAVHAPDGLLHSVWVAQEGRTSSLQYQVRDVAGRTLFGPMVIAESSARIRRPQLAIDGGGSIHFLWQERQIHRANPQTVIKYTSLKLASSGAVTTLAQPVMINRDPTATHPSLAVDHAGWAYAVWEIEGRSVVLAAIDPSGRIGQVRHITNYDTKTGHALPTVAVDRRGNVHVVWSVLSGDRTQLIYKAFRGHGGQVLEKERIIYTTSGAAAQTKVVTFDAKGNIKISWADQVRQHGRVAKADRGRGYLVLRHGHSGGASTVATVADQSLTAQPGPVVSVTGEAVISPKPRMDAPSTHALLSVLEPLPARQLSAVGDEAVSKLLMERLLRYSTWSAAPPSVERTAVTRLLLSEFSIRSTHSRLHEGPLSVAFPFYSEHRAVCDVDLTDPFAFQPVSFTQGGVITA